MIKSSSSGFTLFEIIMAMFVISIAVIPMMQSFGPAMMTAGAVEKTAVLSNQARATMEQLLALDFDDLKEQPADPDYPDYPDDNFEFEGVSYTPEINIIDASEDGSETLLKLTVTIDDIAFTTLKADY